MNKRQETVLANNILEFLLDPTKFPVQQRLYFRPEEILRNEEFDKAKADAVQAYRDQKKNSDFYPSKNRSSREACIMDRKTVIASLDVLAQHFIDENDPIATDLRTIAFCVSKMDDEEYGKRMASEIDAKKKVEFVKCPKCGNPKVMKQTGYCLKCGEKGIGKDAAAAENCPKCGKPMKDCGCAEASAEMWTKEAAEAVQEALVSDVVGETMEEETPPPAKEPVKEPEEASSKKAVGSPAAPDKPGKPGLLKDDPEKKPAAPVAPVLAKETPKAEPAPKDEPKPVVPPVEAKKDAPAVVPEEEKAEKTVQAKAEEKTEEKTELVPPAGKKAVVDTSILAFEGIEMETGMQDAGELTADEQSRLNQLFQ